MRLIHFVPSLLKTKKVTGRIIPLHTKRDLLPAKRRTKIGLFRFHVCLLFNASLRAKFLWKLVNYHHKNFALRLALKRRRTWTRKWPICPEQNERRIVMYGLHVPSLRIRRSLRVARACNAYLHDSIPSNLRELKQSRRNEQSFWLWITFNSFKFFPFSSYYIQRTTLRRKINFYVQVGDCLFVYLRFKEMVWTHSNSCDKFWEGQFLQDTDGRFTTLRMTCTQSAKTPFHKFSEVVRSLSWAISGHFSLGGCKVQGCRLRPLYTVRFVGPIDRPDGVGAQILRVFWQPMNDQFMEMKIGPNLQILKSGLQSQRNRHIRDVTFSLPSPLSLLKLPII